MYKKLPWKPSTSLYSFYFVSSLLFTDENICEFTSSSIFLFVFIVIHKVGYQETIRRSGKKKNTDKI